MRNLKILVVIFFFMVMVVSLSVLFVKFDDIRRKEIYELNKTNPKSIRVLTLDGDTAIISSDCGHLVIKLKK